MLTKHLIILTAALMLIGAGCPLKTSPVLELPTVPPSAEPAPDPSIEPQTPNLAPYYISYSPEAAARATREGRPIVYYFWAAWCPICKADEPIINARIENSGLPIAGFRVNFDAQSDLKAQYKIPYQHTTVFLNAAGVEVARLNGPVSDAEFNANLALAAK